MSIHIFAFPSGFSTFHGAHGRNFQQLQHFFSLLIKDWADVSKFVDDGPWNNWSFQVLIGIILVVFSAAFFTSLPLSVPCHENSQRSRTALQALQTVLVPSCSLWPARYIQLVKRASMNSDLAPGSRIIIPLSMLLQDICNGVIELRDPVYDFEDLIDGGVCAYGCCVSVSIDWKWWVEWLDRALRGEISDDAKKYSAVYISYLPDTLAGTRLIHPLSRASVDHGSIINLDCQPLSHLATIQLPKGSSTTIEFTSLSNHISSLSTKHVLCMIPFLARRLPHCLPDVLAKVDDTRKFRLSTLTNTSMTYAEALAATSTMLTNDYATRKRCIDELGIRGWRERRLMLDLEGAFVRKGWLEHWSVVLEVC